MPRQPACSKASDPREPAQDGSWGAFIILERTYLTTACSKGHTEGRECPEVRVVGRALCFTFQSHSSLPCTCYTVCFMLYTLQFASLIFALFSSVISFYT